MITRDDETRFVQTVSQGDEGHKFYVYMLCRGDGQPFYVGKGQGGRLFNHKKEADEILEEINSDKELTEDEKSLKRTEMYDKLQIIEAEGEHLKCVVVKWGLTEGEAFMCESALINALGFCRGKTIAKLANRVNGHASKVEKECPSDIKTKAREVDVFLQDCAIREMSVDSIHACIALIKINDFYPRCVDEENGSVDIAKVKDCTRGIWHIGDKKKTEVEYLFALYRGRIVGIFHVIGVSQRAGLEVSAPPALCA